MKLPITESFLKRGIKMEKVLSRGFFGNIYDTKTVYDIEEVVLLSNDGWSFNQGWAGFNLALMLFRDLSKLSESVKGGSNE